jgi:anti-anti-sigma factor
MFRVISPAVDTERLTARATVSRHVALVALGGELDAGTAVGALDLIQAVLAAGAREVLVDLSETTTINEAGVATLHEAANATGERGSRIYVFHAPGHLAGRLG